MEREANVENRSKRMSPLGAVLTVLTATAIGLGGSSYLVERDLAKDEEERREIKRLDLYDTVSYRIGFHDGKQGTSVDDWAWAYKEFGYKNFDVFRDNPRDLTFKELEIMDDRYKKHVDRERSLKK